MSKMRFLCHKIALISLILGLSGPFFILNSFNLVTINNSNISCWDNGVIDGFNSQTMFPITVCRDNIDCLKNLCHDNADGIFVEKWISTGKQYDFVALSHKYYHAITFIIVYMFLTVIFNLVILYKIYDKYLVFRRTISVIVIIICAFITISTIFYSVNVHSKTINNLDCLGNISITGYGYSDGESLKPITDTEYCSDIGCFIGNSIFCKNQHNESVIATSMKYGGKSLNQIDLLPLSSFIIDLFLILCVIFCIPLIFTILLCDCGRVMLEINGIEYIV